MTDSAVTHLLVALAVVLVVGRVFGGLARRAWQPAVCGEIVAGVLLGPTLLGRFLPPEVAGDSVTGLSVLADLGVMALMVTLGAGLRVTSADLPRRSLARIVAGAVLVPAVGGTLTGVVVIAERGPASVLFVGVALTVTAFPVLARILVDCGMRDTPIGRLALSVAAVNDMVAWLLLGIVAVVAGGETGGRLHLALTPVYLAAMAWLLRPLLRRVAANDRRRSSAAVQVFLLAGLCASAATAQWLGVGFVMGAFVFGLCLPRGHGSETMARDVDRAARPAVRVLLPLYFVLAGMAVDLRSIDARGVLLLVVLVVVAAGTKLGGTFVGARWAGVDRGGSEVLAVLMNTRGLTELVVLGTGLQLGVLNRDLYTLMVIVSLITTGMTGPLLRLVGGASDADARRLSGRRQKRARVGTPATRSP